MTTLLILLALTVSVVSAARIYRQRMRDQHREALMNRVIGGRPDVPVRGTQKAKAIQAIIDFGIEKAQVTFGQELGRCYRCGLELTDETSRSLGIGPVCREK